MKLIKTFMAGFGGQGVVSLGQIWAYCAMKEGLQVTFFPSYGAEKRGGITRASTVISDEEIASPVVAASDTAIVMDEESLATCESMVCAGGTLIINSDLVRSQPKRSDVKIINISCNKIAEKIGDIKIANMVMLGVLVKLTGIIPLTTIESTLKSFFSVSKHKFIPLNMAAIQAGYQAL